LPRGLFGVKRGGGEDAQAIFMIANVTGDVVSASVNRWGASAGFGPMRDLLSGEVLAEGTGSRKVSIGPWRVVWLVSDGLGEGGAATGK